MKINILGIKTSPIARELFIEEWHNRRGELLFFGLGILADVILESVCLFLIFIGSLTMLFFYGFSSEEFVLVGKIITANKISLTIYAVSIFNILAVILMLESSLRHLYVAAESGYKSLCEYWIARQPLRVRLHNGRAQRYQTDKARAKKRDSL